VLFVVLIVIVSLLPFKVITADRINDYHIRIGAKESFPPGCTWECYLDRNPFLERKKYVHRTEKEALAHYQRIGAKKNWDCSCEKNPEEKKTRNNGNKKEEKKAAPSAESISTTTKKASEKSDVSFPPGCTWECYLDRNPFLEKKKYVQRTQEEALAHYQRIGAKKNWDCSCKNNQEEKKMGNNGNKKEEKKKALSVESMSTSTKKAPEKSDVSFPQGCTWECYLDRNPELEKDGVPRTEEGALAHYQKHGAKKNRNCSCKDGYAMFLITAEK